MARSTRPDLALIENCPHCSAVTTDLQVEKMYLGYVGETDDPDPRTFVYCTVCGHWGDLDTWNNRV